MNSHIQGQSIFNKRAKSIQQGKEGLFKNGVGKTMMVA